MRNIRLAGLVLVAASAASLAISSTAAAAGPLYITSGKPTFTASGKHLLILSGGTADRVECAAYMWVGEVSSTTLVGNVFIRFLACTGKDENGAECPVMSAGAQLENLITTNTLHGVLGLVLPKPSSGSNVALVLLPTSGKSWFTLLGSCIKESSLEGNTTGVVEPVGVSSTTDKVVFGVVTSIKQAVDLSTGGSLTTKLVYAGEGATLESEDEYIYSAKVEVT
jgi:hypothetical protein